jgi:signal transduction histidine kinase
MEQKTSPAYVEQLEQQVKNLQHLLEINNVMNSVLLRNDVGIDALLRYLMEAAAKITDCEGASVLLWDKVKNRLVFAATTTENKASRDLVGKAVPLDSIAGTIYKERRVIQVDNTEADPRHYDAFDETLQFKTRSLLGVPMISNDNVIGVLEVVNKRSLPWTETDRNNLTTLAGEAAIAIEVGQLVVALQSANAELSELDKLKSDFIAIASHELRTPLGIILGYASFLQESEDRAVRAQATKVMDGALQLRRIIESMINLRYVKQKTSDLYRQEASFNSVMKDLERDTRTLTNASANVFSFEPLEQDVAVNVDRSRLLMAFANILSNALAFSNAGDPIEISARQREDEVLVAVRDYGIGIEADQLDLIFDEFYQVEDHMTRHHGGLGIGLSISRALVEAHGGRIWAHSGGINKGATITVALPLA